MHNACTRLGCESNRTTTALTDSDGRAWAHLCAACLRTYQAEIAAANAKDPCAEKTRPITMKYAGGEDAWRRYVFGPFGGAAQRKQRKVLAGTPDSSTGD
jgi:hypothetical protein